MGCLLQIADGGKPNHIMAKSFPVFPAETGSLIYSSSVDG
jgi:hypothetical protein